MDLSNLPTPMFFAHRGACAYAPENTIPAFLLALEQGAIAIELDVKLTGDGEVVVLHDQTVNRTSNGKGDLRNYSFSQLKRLNANSGFEDQYPKTQIPTLAEVFEAVGPEIWINIELTNYASPQDDLVVKVVKLIRQTNRHPRVLFSSFNPITLRKAMSLALEIPAGLLASPGLSGLVARRYLPQLMTCQAIHPYSTDVTVSLIKSAHFAGRRVHCWTVNDEELMTALFKLGVDAVFTDDPILAGHCLKGLDVLVK